MTAAVIVLIALGIGGFLLRGRWQSRSEVAAVALTLVAGLSSYALTGHPGAPSRPARWIGEDPAVISPYETARTLLLEPSGDVGAWLTYADALGRSGDSLAAIRGLERALADHPASADLWIGLGEALSLHGDGRVGPAARLAFDRAAGLSPNRPAAPYFLGLALLRAGDPAAALAQWRTITPDPAAAWQALLDHDIAAARKMIAPG